MNHNSRYDVSKRKRRDVPEELLHGVSPLPGDVPHAPLLTALPLPVYFTASIT